MSTGGAREKGEGGADEPGAAYLQPYRSAVDRVGARFEALLWNSRETQRARFRAIAQTLALEGRVVLDAGCGRGDFAEYLGESGVACRRYVGIDAIPEMIAFARSRGIERAEFRLRDFVRDPRALDWRLDAGADDKAAGAARATTTAGAEKTRPDIIVFCGSLNTMTREMALGVLARAWEACGEGLIFNFLSRYDPTPVPRGSGVALRLSPVEMLEWALERTTRVVLRHEYLEGRDGTIGMVK